MNKKKNYWLIAGIIIAILSIWVIVSQSSSFSWESLKDEIEKADKSWLLVSVACTFGFIFFEGMAMRSILKAIASGWKKKKAAIVYAAADVYFSAITPSASGGQPAMIYFMSKDGIPMAAITASLLLNLIMYLISLFLIGIFGIFAFPGLLPCYSTIAKFLVGIGFFVLVLFMVAFGMLLFHGKLLHRIVYAVFHIFDRFIKTSDPGHKYKHLDDMIAEYHECVEILTGQRIVAFRAFLWNMMQRLSQLMVSVCIYLAIGTDVSAAGPVWAAQLFSAVGSNSLPVPGGMGAADYLLIEGFSLIPQIPSAANFALLCRGIAFYLSVFLSIIIVLTGYLCRRNEN